MKWYQMRYNIPFGPKVTDTAFARTSTPARIDALPSLENLISLWAPRANTGFADLAARRAADEEDSCKITYGYITPVDHKDIEILEK